jgi:hypothetical protein
MSATRLDRRARLLAALLGAALASLSFGLSAGAAAAQGLEDEGGAEWRLEPIVPPQLPSGGKSTTPIGLGSVGDMEFWAPNRGLLTTAGNGSTIPAGLWAYNGVGWHELSTVCGATDGRIAWAGPEDFWTISDGRPGQAADPNTGRPAPVQDNTLCHFSGGQVVTSYASRAFQANSYQAMHAAGCLNGGDCWFAGDPLPAPQVGSFHLHWYGGTLKAEAEPSEQAASHVVGDMRAFEGKLYESPLLSTGDVVSEHGTEPPLLRVLNPGGIAPTFEYVKDLPLHGPKEFPEAESFLRLSGAEGALWAAAGPQPSPPSESEPGQVTVLRRAPSTSAWTQLLGPQSTPSGEALFGGDALQGLAAEPGVQAAWMALDSQQDVQSPDPTAPARLARISAAGTISDQATLPGAGEGIGPKGAAKRLVCPGVHDCWMATTQGWLFHLTDRPPGVPPPEGVDGDPAFSGLITSRPPDEGLPQVVPDAPPVDDSGLLGEPPAALAALLPTPGAQEESRVAVALLSRVHTKLVHGTTLELRFHLAVRARVRLLAKRRSRVVASTPSRTFAAGDRKLMLQLNARRWPTKLALQTHALAPLPTVSVRGAANTSVSTAVHVLPRERSLQSARNLP